MTGAVGWRREGIRYKKNELYMDVVETLSALVSPGGEVLRADVSGRVGVRAFLSGTPDVKLGLCDRLEDVAFHPCVNLGRFAAERVVSFVPPDGEFELARYRVSAGVDLPLKATCLIVEQGRTRLEVTVRLRAALPPQLWAAGVTVLAPVPPQTARAAFTLSSGKAKYDARRGALVWKLKRLAGGAEATLVAAVELIATARERRPWGRPPLALTFQVPGYSASGVRVEYVRVWERSGYNVEKWVRKLTKSGDYQIRTS